LNDHNPSRVEVKRASARIALIASDMPLGPYFSFKIARSDGMIGVSTRGSIYCD
jgi:hypothetical protein